MLDRNNVLFLAALGQVVVADDGRSRLVWDAESSCWHIDVRLNSPWESNGRVWWTFWIERKTEYAVDYFLALDAPGAVQAIEDEWASYDATRGTEDEHWAQPREIHASDLESGYIGGAVEW